jgi:hypothetical protein
VYTCTLPENVDFTTYQLLNPLFLLINNLQSLAADPKEQADALDAAIGSAVNSYDGLLWM